MRNQGRLLRVRLQKNIGKVLTRRSELEWMPRNTEQYLCDSISWVRIGSYQVGEMFASHGVLSPCCLPHNNNTQQNMVMSKQTRPVTPCDKFEHTLPSSFLRIKTQICICANLHQPKMRLYANLSHWLFVGNIFQIGTWASNHQASPQPRRKRQVRINKCRVKSRLLYMYRIKALRLG